MVNKTSVVVAFIGLGLFSTLGPEGGEGIFVTPASAQSCHPSNQNVCISPNGGDVDCAGGSGNGPRYVRGPVYVVGPDQYGLDRDRDGIACERG